MAWRAMDPLAGLEDESDNESSDEADLKQGAEEEVEGKTSQGEEIDGVDRGGDKKRVAETQAGKGNKKPALDYEALSRHGYQGGPSILFLPPSKGTEQQNWDWSQGNRKDPDDEEEKESFAEREKFRHIANERSLEVGAQAVREMEAMKKQRMDAAAERKAMSFAQKEKRKRDAGQASRGKNYVEEEKRVLREEGVYSGFDS